MYKATITFLKVLEIILLILLCIAIMDKDTSHATLLAILAFYDSYQANRLKDKYV
jgi:hypothetical protein